MRKTKKRMDLCENALGEVESIYLLYPISATSAGDDRCACDCGNCADVIYSEALQAPPSPMTINNVEKLLISETTNRN